MTHRSAVPYQYTFGHINGHLEPNPMLLHKHDLSKR